jgi:hypothetical protein
MGDVKIIDVDAARRRLINAADQIEQRTFATAAMSEQHDEFSGFKAKIDILQDGSLNITFLKLFRQVVDVYGGSSRILIVAERRLG